MEFSLILKEVGELKPKLKTMILFVPHFSLKLEFTKNEEVVNAYFDLRRSVEQVEIYHDGERVGNFYRSEGWIPKNKVDHLFKLAKEIESKMSFKTEEPTNLPKN